MDFELKMALRDSETATRPYVLLNPKLAKHLPMTPSLALGYFTELGRKIAAVCRGEKVLVTGFAETATAVGAAAASAIEGAVYVHTTREGQLTKQDDLVVDFFEEHSHARNQSLYLRAEYRDLSAYDRIVFIEDEITTGKTILNLLQHIEYSGKITVAALVFNGLDESAFAQYNADFFCLHKVGYVRYLAFEGLPDPRAGVSIKEYREKCADLALKITAAIGETDLNGKNILVLGTEEFMYPALALGCELEKTANSVKSHSTTRSPLLPQSPEDDSLYSRCDFSSVYDVGRKTYLYNLEKYDTVIVLTDAPRSDGGELLQIIQNSGNQTIYYVRVQNAC